MAESTSAAGTVTVLLAAALLSGCGATSFGSPGCRDADPGLAKEAMSTRGRDFRAGDSIISKMELVRSRAIDLPEDLRDYGATSLVSVRAAVFPKRTAGSSIPGVETSSIFAVSGDGELVGPVGKSARTLFAVPEPEEPGWREWSTTVYDSDVALELLDCSDGL